MSEDESRDAEDETGEDEPEELDLPTTDGEPWAKTSSGDADDLS